MNQENKVLILGAGGNLGSQLRQVLANEYRLLLWDREEVDALDFEVLEAKVKEHRPNLIINCVAYNAVDKCEEDEAEFELAKKLNADLPGALSDMAIAIDAALLHFTSDYVFSGDQTDGYKESDASSPVNRYGQSKAMGEAEIMKRADQGLKYHIVRTSKLFGPKGESGSAKPSFFDIIASLAKERSEFKMVHGEEISCFTYTLDLARAVKALVESKQISGIYHIVNEGPASWYDGAKHLFELKGLDKKLIPVSSADLPRPARRPRCSVLLNTKLPKLRPWQEALAEYFNNA